MCRQVYACTPQNLRHKINSNIYWVIYTNLKKENNQSMKKTSRILAIVLTICMSITAMATLAACPDKGFELESFTVDMSTIKTTYKVGEEVDFSGIPTRSIINS